MSPRAASRRKPVAIPVIDIAGHLAGVAGARAAVAAQVREAMETVGFMVVVGHGVSQSLVDRTFAEARRFHAQPLERKSALAMNEHNNGYMAQGRYAITTSEHAETDAPEMNEAFFVKRERADDDPQVWPGRRFVGPNRWPDGLPGFRETVLEYADAMEGLAMSLLPAVAVALGLEPGFFDTHFGCSQYSVRLSHYPPAPRGAGRFGIAPHSDMNFMTFLPQSAVPGLQVRLAGGEWVDVPALPGSMAVNSGDTLARWTNGRFKSTPHRALPPEHEHRYAIPFFLGPDVDATIECLPTCRSPGNPPRWPAIRYEDWIRFWYDRNYDHRDQAGT